MVTQADLDANGDGVITFDEFWASVIKTHGCGNEDGFAEDFAERGTSLEDWARETEKLKAALLTAEEAAASSTTSAVGVLAANEV